MPNPPVTSDVRLLALLRHKSADRYRKEMANRDCEVSFAANQTINHLTCVPERAIFNICEIANPELGFEEGCTRKEAFTALRDIGALMLPAEAALQYCIDFRDPPGPWRMLFMAPVTVVGGSQMIFGIRGRGQEDGPFLNVFGGRDDNFYDASTIWLCAFPLEP